MSDVKKSPEDISDDALDKAQGGGQRTKDGAAISDVLSTKPATQSGEIISCNFDGKEMRITE